MRVVGELAQLDDVHGEPPLLARGADHPLRERRREEVGEDGEDADAHEAGD